MSKIKIIKVPQKGGLTIPQNILEKLGFKRGAVLALFEAPEYITLKKVSTTPTEELRKTIEDLRKFAKEKKIKKKNIVKAIKAARE